MWWNFAKHLIHARWRGSRMRKFQLHIYTLFFEEPFSRVIVDCGSSLPRTKSGNMYLLPIMCASARYREAMLLRNISVKMVVKTLISFFTKLGLQKVNQSDQGSELFWQVFKKLRITFIKASAYYPQSEGALARFHCTLKNMMWFYCLDHQKEWDEGILF